MRGRAGIFIRIFAHFSYILMDEWLCGWQLIFSTYRQHCEWTSEAKSRLFIDAIKLQFVEQEGLTMRDATVLFSFHVLELITELELSLLNISISPLPSQICHNRIKTNSAASHYRAVCRALVAEVGDLKLFLQKISDGETEQMRLSVDAQASKQELDQLFLNDWVSKSQRGSGHKNLQTEGEFVN